MKSAIARRIAGLCVLMLVSLGATAQARQGARVWTFGAARSSVYDAYLSPLNYRGAGGSVTMTNERTARWCGKALLDSTSMESVDRVTSYAVLDVSASCAGNRSRTAHLYDAEVLVAAGWHCNWLVYPRLGQRLRLRAGGLAELSGGGSYSTRNGNNPAQGRAAFDVAASGIADYYFHSPFRRQHTPWMCRVEVDVPLLGAMFSPQYGQSYYELFSLGHYDRNVRATWPGNAPSARLTATLQVPIRKACIVVGYRGDARQSRVNHLDRHAWQNGIVLGFVRQLNL